MALKKGQTNKNTTMAQDIAAAKKANPGISQAGAEDVAGYMRRARSGR